MSFSLSKIQKELFKKISGFEYNGDETFGYFMTDKPYNNTDYKHSPWFFTYKFEKDTGYLICELSHRMTNNRVYGWDQFGNELSEDITKKFFNSDFDSIVTLENENNEQNKQVIKFSNNGAISAQRVKDSVYSRIDFELPEHIWEEINFAFGDCWNNLIGVTGWVYESQIENHIFNHLKNKKIIFDYEKIERIVKIIFDYISMSGGWLEK